MIHNPGEPLTHGSSCLAEGPYLSDSNPPYMRPFGNGRTIFLSFYSDHNGKTRNAGKGEMIVGNYAACPKLPNSHSICIDDFHGLSASDTETYTPGGLLSPDLSDPPIGCEPSLFLPNLGRVSMPIF